jgi:HlyD family secretion protein
MRRWLLILIILIVLGAGGYVAYQAGLLSSLGLTPPAADLATAEVEATPAAETTQPSLNSVVADARVVPVQEATLSLAVGGIVKEILVSEGDQVEAGQLLLRLSDAQQQVAVAQAQANLQRAQATLEQLLAGPLEAEIASAQALLAHKPIWLRHKLPWRRYLKAPRKNS